MGASNTTFHLTLSGDVYLKSKRTQTKLISRARNNLNSALATNHLEPSVRRIGTHRYEIVPRPDEAEALVAAALSVFGFATLEAVTEVPFTTFEELVDNVAALTGSSVEGRSFAVRARRTGTHPWRSLDVARAVGTALVECGGRVDLTNPEVTVRVSVFDNRAYTVTDQWKAAGGLPLGTQERVLGLLSGGFDSAVASWLMMSRGCPVDFVHFSLNCAQSDHALAVARELWARWGHGTSPEVHLVEFQPVKDALIAEVQPSMRQVALKVMMAEAASAIAAEQGILALVTGDSLGQVSSQTLPHLAAVSGSASIPILRPLVGLPKEMIIDLARQIGTAELSARAQEVCDLSGGSSVATSAHAHRISRSVERVPESVLADALTTRKMFDLSDWSPGRF